NSSLNLSITLTAVVTLSYIDMMTLTSHSSTFSFLNAHHNTSDGTLSKAFSRSTKAIHNSLPLHKYFSCNWRTMKIASVVPLPGLNPNCKSSRLTLVLKRFSMILSNTFMYDLVILSLYMIRNPVHHPYLCRK